MFTSKKKDQDKVDDENVGSHRQVTQAATDEENKDGQVRTVTDSNPSLSGASGNTHDYGAFDDSFRGGNFHRRGGDRRGGKPRRGRGGHDGQHYERREHGEEGR